jgi:LDH2 family malate/lactate/ureidoglycolate dehydrogenase
MTPLPVEMLMADAIGHNTHGLAQFPDYLEELAAGRMTPASA